MPLQQGVRCSACPGVLPARILFWGLGCQTYALMGVAVENHFSDTDAEGSSAGRTVGAGLACAVRGWRCRPSESVVANFLLRMSRCGRLFVRCKIAASAGNRIHQGRAASEPLVRPVWRRFELRQVPRQGTSTRRARCVRGEEDRQTACRMQHKTMRFWGVWVRRKRRTAEICVQDSEGLRVVGARRAVLR